MVLAQTLSVCANWLREQVGKAALLWRGKALDWRQAKGLGQG
jgi:hypothetical protein